MKWDVVIAGAGPAGAVAAGVLSRAGRRVLLVDDVSSNKCKVGESLPSAARPLLRDLGLLPLVEEGPHLPSYGNISAWGSSELNDTDFIQNPNGMGWHLDRSRFDMDLRQAAQSDGALLLPARLKSVTAIQDGWQIQLSTGETNADWIVDATGRHATLARNLGINRQRDDTLVALCAWAEASDSDLDTRSLVESTPDGWWYTALLPNRLRVVVLHVDREYAVSIIQKQEIWLDLLSQTMHISHVLSGAVFKDKPYGTEACGGCLDYFAGKGWLTIGDAAISFDPLSSQGIFNALYTGMRAGQAINAALNKDDELIDYYTGQLENIRQAYLYHHQTFYQLEYRWPNHSFWARRQ